MPSAVSSFGGGRNLQIPCTLSVCFEHKSGTRYLFYFIVFLTKKYARKVRTHLVRISLNRFMDFNGNGKNSVPTEPARGDLNPQSSESESDALSNCATGRYFSKYNTIL